MHVMPTRPRIAAIVVGLGATALLATCTLVSDFSGLTTAAAGANGAGGGAECAGDGDCEQPDAACRRTVCAGGVCVPTTEEQGVPTPSQTYGDCHREVCDGSGQVTTVVDDEDLPDAGVCSAGTCLDGSAGSELEPSGTECNPAKCEGNVAAQADTCDGEGTCENGAEQDCGAYACTTNPQGEPECLTSCGSEQDCAPGYTCSGGSCG